MSNLTKSSQIWKLQPTRDDRLVGAKYAAVTLPWTFNRMMLNTSSSGQQSRALNIAKGVVGQEVLRQALIARGVAQKVQKKSYRDDDLFDFRMSLNGVDAKLDVKTVNYYTDYGSLGREPLTSNLIMANAAYPGPDWRHFFPMLVPHTQIGQGKEAYCFAIASSIDFRHNIDKNREHYDLTAFPFGEPLPFLCSSKLCKIREEAGKGFYITCSYESDSLLGQAKLPIMIIGEWAGKAKRVLVNLRPGTETADVGPFSCLSSIQIDREAYDQLYGQFTISVTRNDFTDIVYNSSKKNINVPPSQSLSFQRSDFCNLVLPSDYTLYFIGWITREDFLQKCKCYPGWVWPKDSENKYVNQSWSQITESDQHHLEQAGFSDCIQKKPRLLRAGWMKTNGHGGGACCYVFPNIGMNGGVKETNLYVLPQDLHPMNELGA